MCFVQVLTELNCLLQNYKKKSDGASILTLMLFLYIDCIPDEGNDIAITRSESRNTPNVKTLQLTHRMRLAPEKK